MKNIFSLVILILTSFHLNGQTAGFNYIPLEFENLDPMWIHDIYDSTIIGHVIDSNPLVKFDGYSHVVRSRNTNPRLLTTDDAVYLASSFQYDNDVGGAIVEKINLMTGEIEWKTVYDLRTQDVIEYAYNIRIENDRLILYCIYQNEDNNYIATMVGNGLGYLSRKEYDLETGLLLQQTIPDTVANDMILLRSPYYDTELHLLDDTTVQSIRLGRWYESGSFLVIDTMDTDGVRLTPTYNLDHELFLDWEDAVDVRANLFEKDPYTGDIYSIDYFNPKSQGPEAKLSQLLRYGRDNIREVVPFEYDDYENLKILELRQITDTHLIMVADNEDGVSSDFLFVDKETGSVDRKIYYSRRLADGFDLFLYEGEIITMNFSKTGDYYYLNIFKSEGSEMKIIKSFRLGFPDYILRGSSLHMLENGDFIIDFQYQGFSPSGLPSGFFSGIMRVTPAQLGLTTSSSYDKEIVDAPFQIFPNPSSDVITVKSDIRMDYDIIIYDMMGRVVSTFDADAYSTDINIRALLPGQYYLQMVTEKNSYGQTIIKK